MKLRLLPDICSISVQYSIILTSILLDIFIGNNLYYTISYIIYMNYGIILYYLYSKEYWLEEMRTQKAITAKVLILISQKYLLYNMQMKNTIKCPLYIKNNKKKYFNIVLLI